MQFKNPLLLYALFLLLIPILIHLFQLRRFQKVDFTNVAFLKKVNIQTRKSSQLKKWLTLLMRLLALACIIFAFAQPFSASKTALNANKETVLYIDNSFSMEAKGANGTLMQRAIQDIFKETKDGNKISWFTNNSSKKDAPSANFKSEILKTEYTHKQLTPTEVLLKAEQLFSKDQSADKRIIYVSDFQLKESFPVIKGNYSIDAVQLKPQAITNISIDSAYVISKSNNKIDLEVLLTAKSDTHNTVSVSLFNGNVLVAKSAVDFSDVKQQKANFSFENSEGFKGHLSITDSGLTYDNDLYFSINKPTKLKVLSINEANSDFLQRMYNETEFEYTRQDSRSLNYSIIPEQNCIILNELKEIPASLSAALQAFSDNGGSVLIIPSKDSSATSYNQLLKVLNLGSISEEIIQEKNITQIVFDHPIYADVFEKRVVNFQYPKVNSFYETTSLATPILKFEDGKPFILNNDNAFFSTASFNDANSNFISSPLIVPTLYNIARSSLKLPALYFEVGSPTRFAVPVSMIQDEILTIRDSIVSFIPLQQTKANKVLISTNENPSVSGTFSIEKKQEFVENVSYNYARNESNLQYADVDNWDGVETHKSISNLFDAIAEENNINEFWKWFVIGAFLFLLAEMLILKFVKR
ncbi:membrane protein [Patiriisocius marinistellae]|uniref:Membrane protein n=1 Tax=Patiriisocius marinistellae TaxID=2494560 RepID=A0A5J4FWE6_9FLAO|nr:BatA domain-containing protein [Patiriisocius marinistellae]GEQ86480.1 membrane protein [Patiriisocius marinistellae]